jgi:hypothetical protein
VSYRWGCLWGCFVVVLARVEVMERRRKTGRGEEKKTTLLMSDENWTSKKQKNGQCCALSFLHFSTRVPHAAHTFFLFVLPLNTPTRSCPPPPTSSPASPTRSARSCSSPSPPARLMNSSLSSNRLSDFLSPPLGRG